MQNQEGTLDRNKEDYDKNFKEIKFPKKTVSAKDKRETAQKAFLRPPQALHTFRRSW